MNNGKIVPIEDRIPKLKQKKRRKANRILIFYIFIFFLLMVSILYFQSPLSKVSSISVNGNRYVDKQSVIDLSEIRKDTNIWKVDKEQAEENISKHAEIKSATVEMKFPNNVNIEIVEQQRVAYLFDNSNIYPIVENGKILDRLSSIDTPGDAPLLINWESAEMIQEMAAQLKRVPEGITSLISEIHHAPTDTDSMHITLFMSDGFEVSATIPDFSEKIVAYPMIVDRLPAGSEGIIDLEVGYYFRPYLIEEADRDEGEG
jgi:cell division protein FtsQ